MGIVAQSACIGAVAVAPCGYLHACVPLIQFLLIGSITRIHSILSPMAHTELAASAQQFVLHQQHVQESLCILIKLLAAECLVVGNGLLILHTSLVGQRLSGDVHQIVFKVVVAAILLCHAVHQFGSLLGVSRVIIVLHLRPARSLEVVQRWASAEDTLVRPLLVVACRTVVDALSQYHPRFLDSLILYAVARLHIVLYPSLLGKLLRAPGQFAHQLKHHWIVLASLHCKSYALAVLLTRVEVIQQLVHTSVQSYVATKVLKHTEQPLVLLVTLLALPYAGYAEHGAALREQVEHQQIAGLHAVHHSLAWVFGPALYHPYCLRIHSLHGLHHSLASLGIVYRWVVVTLVEWVHRVVVGLAEQLCQLIII